MTIQSSGDQKALRNLAMRWARRSWRLWNALVLVVLISSCENNPAVESVPSPSAPIPTQHARRAEFKAYFVNLARDVPQWKGNLQNINPRKLFVDRTAATAIEEKIAGITKSLDGLQARIPMLAQQETLGGDIELLAGLQAVASDAASLEFLLSSTVTTQITTRNRLVTTRLVSAWSEQLQKMQQQVGQQAAKLQAQSLALAQNPDLLFEDVRNRWSSKDSVELVKTLAWPLAAAFALVIFHRPLSRFLEQLAGKITKVSVFDVAIELATVPSAPTPWLDPAIYAGTELFGGAITDTTIKDLFERIRDDMVWNYLMVDLKNGQHWLESRLYLFTTILQEMGGLRCVIFVQSIDSGYRRFLGIAAPQSVRCALEKKYEQFPGILLKSVRSALSETLQQNQQSNAEAQIAIVGPLPKNLAENLSKKFIFDDEMQKQQDPQNPGWSMLRKDGPWDHSHWLTMELFNNDLRSVLFDPNLSQFEDSPDISATERTQALLRRPVPFVAMVDKNGMFQRLIDRTAFLSQVAAKLGEPS